MSHAHNEKAFRLGFNSTLSPHNYYAMHIHVGEEEEQYWQKVVEGGKNKAKAKGMGRRDRKFGRPGRGGYGGRKRRQKSSASEDVDGEGGASPPVAKQPKSEDKEE